MRYSFPHCWAPGKGFFPVAGAVLAMVIGVMLTGISPSLAQTGNHASTSTDEEPALFGRPDKLSQPIFTDRPTFSLGPGTVAKGHIQFETGYTFSYENAQPDRYVHLFPETLIRIGLHEKFEFRVEWPNFADIRNGQDIFGLTDLGLGFKLRISEQQRFLPQFSIAGRMTIPTGDDDLSSDAVDPELRTILAYAISQDVGVFGNLNVAGTTSQDKRFVQVSSSLGMSAVLRENLTGVVEYFGFYPREVAGGSGHFLQTAFLYLISHNLQFDARVGAGLTRGTDDFLTGAGLSWRF